MNPSTRIRFFCVVALTSMVVVFAPMTSFAGDAANGEALYTANCSSCHGVTGKGDGPVGLVLQPPPRDFSQGDFKLDTDEDGSPGTDADLKSVISKGAAEFGGNQMMAPWGGILSDADVDDVIIFVRTLKK
ncbi:MAG: cytochrome c [Myxococcota bacterium]